METKSRVGWMTVLVAASALVVAVFVLYLIATLVGIRDYRSAVSRPRSAGFRASGLLFSARQADH